MQATFEPRLDVLPPAQREIWPRLAAAKKHSLVLYGGTAIALHLGHRQSIDFDFFSAEPLDKEALRTDFGIEENAPILQDGVNTLVLSIPAPSGAVKVSFFGALHIGRVSTPMLTADHGVYVASLLDLLSTKLKATMDRAEFKDYIDIAALLRHGVKLADGIAAFRTMFRGEPAQVLRALGYFEDGDLPSLDRLDRQTLVEARDAITDLPVVSLVSRSLL